MPTLTIQLPDSAYRDALAFAPEERARLIAVAFTVAKSALPEQEDDPTTEQDLLAIGKSLAEEAEGHVLDGDVVMADMREMLRKRRELRPK